MASELLFVLLQPFAPRYARKGPQVITIISLPHTFAKIRLVEETNDLASNVLSASLLMVHDTGRGGQDDVTELTRWKKLDNPLLEIGELDVVAWGDDTSLVEAVRSSIR